MREPWHPKPSNVLRVSFGNELDEGLRVMLGEESAEFSERVRFTEELGPNPMYDSAGFHILDFDMPDSDKFGPLVKALQRTLHLAETVARRFGRQIIVTSMWRSPPLNDTPDWARNRRGQKVTDHEGRFIRVFVPNAPKGIVQGAGGSPGSFHKKAMAFDFVVPGVRPIDVGLRLHDMMAMRRIPFGGIGVYHTFNHLDWRFASYIGKSVKTRIFGTLASAMKSRLEREYAEDS